MKYRLGPQADRRRQIGNHRGRRRGQPAADPRHTASRSRCRKRHEAAYRKAIHRRHGAATARRAFLALFHEFASSRRQGGPNPRSQCRKERCSARHAGRSTAPSCMVWTTRRRVPRGNALGVTPSRLPRHSQRVEIDRVQSVCLSVAPNARMNRINVSPLRARGLTHEAPVHRNSGAEPDGAKRR